jgi:hypothetical protein
MLNLSLSGCGFLGVYHIGVVSAFREHRPEFIEGKISGCSAGALVAACVACDCCLGQMVSDVLEAALKARKYSLGALHPSFSIVDIVRNGLRRILPVDAHKICSNRVHISVTRWKDGKNFIINQFDSREELIQALVCSSFVPCYSGFVPPKFRDSYYWDGGLSNNNPILDSDTILVSPFAGESDICPREETAAFSSIDFQGTIIQFSNENLYRISKALFPPEPAILKAICFRGYKDGVSFLKSRNLLECSCSKFLRPKTTLYSVIGEDFEDVNAYDDYSKIDVDEDRRRGENENDAESVITSYDSDEEKINQYAHSNEPLKYEEMPVSVCEILDTAVNDNTGLISYIQNSQVSRLVSIAFLPWTLPIEFSFNFSKRVINLLPQMKAKSNSYIVDLMVKYMNAFIERLTYDKYQYHARMNCKCCVEAANHSEDGDEDGDKDTQRTMTANSMQFDLWCHHNNLKNKENQERLEEMDVASMKSGASSRLYSRSDVTRRRQRTTHSLNGLPRLCARHRVPSVSSDTNYKRIPVSNSNYKQRSAITATASSVDDNEYKINRPKYPSTSGQSTLHYSATIGNLPSRVRSLFFFPLFFREIFNYKICFLETKETCEH